MEPLQARNDEGAAQCFARLGVCAGRLMDMVLPVEEPPTNCLRYNRDLTLSR